MTRVNIKILIFALSLIFSLTACSTGKGKLSIKSKEGYFGLVGYGSLISLQSMEETLGRRYQDSIYLVHLDGYKREWTDFSVVDDSPSAQENDYFYMEGNDTVHLAGIISLNISAADKNSKMNCVLYLVTKDDLVRFDERESGYQRIDVTSEIEEFDFKETKVYTYQTLSQPDFTTYTTPKAYVIPQEYIDLVYHACDSIGNVFRMEFDESTVPYAPRLKVGKIEKKKRIDN